MLNGFFKVRYGLILLSVNLQVGLTIRVAIVESLVANTDVEQQIIANLPAILEVPTGRLAVEGVYPVGGGLENAINLKQGLGHITQKTGKAFTNITYDQTRAGDQPYFVADLSWKNQAGISWQPKTDVEQGVEVMVNWIHENRDRICQVLG